MHASIRAGNAWNGERDVPDATHILTGIVKIKHPLGDLDLATAGCLQTQKLQWEVQAQGAMFRQFVLANVLIEVPLLHLALRQLQPFARKQTLVQVIPCCAGQEVAHGVAPFIVERSLGLPGGAEHQFVHVAV